MYVLPQKNSRCCFSVFVIFGLWKIRKIQFLPKIAKFASNKSFLFAARIFIKVGKSEDKGCILSHNKFQDVVLPSFWYLAYDK